MEISKELYDILTSGIAFDVARFGKKNPSYFDWAESEPGPYDFYEAITELHKIGKDGE